MMIPSVLAFYDKYSQLSRTALSYSPHGAVNIHSSTWTRLYFHLIAVADALNELYGRGNPA